MSSRAGLQPPGRGLAVAADGDLGEQLLHRDRFERGVAVNPARRVSTKGPDARHPWRGRDHDAPMIRRGMAFSKWTRREPSQHLLVPPRRGRQARR